MQTVNSLHPSAVNSGKGMRLWLKRQIKCAGTVSKTTASITAKRSQTTHASWPGGKGWKWLISQLTMQKQQEKVSITLYLLNHWPWRLGCLNLSIYLHYAVRGVSGVPHGMVGIAKSAILARVYAVDVCLLTGHTARPWPPCTDVSILTKKINLDCSPCIEANLMFRMVINYVSFFNSLTKMQPIS